MASYDIDSKTYAQRGDSGKISQQLKTSIIIIKRANMSGVPEGKNKPNKAYL
jgi:hypothetical protein